MSTGGFWPGEPPAAEESDEEREPAVQDAPA